MISNQYFKAISNMKNLFDFSTGTISSFGFLISVDRLGFLNADTIDQLLSTFIALIGGIISTIILSVIRAKFPKLFKPFSSTQRNDATD